MDRRYLVGPELLSEVNFGYVVNISDGSIIHQKESFICKKLTFFEFGLSQVYRHTRQSKIT